MKTSTKSFIVTVSFDKDIADVTDVIAQRVYTLDGVTDVTCADRSMLEDAPQFRTKSFEEKIVDFNKLYALPTLSYPALPQDWLDPIALMKHFKNFSGILNDELDEVDDILTMISEEEDQLTVLTAIADWLGDIMIYCASEMKKFGLPIELVLSIIMASNMSKADENGKPIYDDRGKVMKGPNYWKPEPQISRALAALSRETIRNSKTQ